MTGHFHEKDVHIDSTIIQTINYIDHRMQILKQIDNPKMSTVKNEMIKSRFRK